MYEHKEFLIMIKNRHYYLFSIIFIFIFLMALGIKDTSARFFGLNQDKGNIVTIGELNLEVKDVFQTTPILESGRGYQEVLHFCAQNGSRVPIKISSYLIPGQDDEDLIHQISVKVVQNPIGMTGNYGPLNSVIVTDIPLIDLLENNALILLDKSTILPEVVPFGTGKEICFNYYMRLLPSAGNDLLGSSLQFKVVINAAQWNNPDWRE